MSGGAERCCLRRFPLSRRYADSIYAPEAVFFAAAIALRESGSMDYFAPAHPHFTSWRIMPLKSMTGFGRSGGQDNGASWVWELRTVNGRGLDLRFRLPPGMEAFELRLREHTAKAMARGNCAVSLALKLPAGAGDVRLNETALLRFAELAERARALTRRDQPVTLDALLGFKGVLENVEGQASEEGGAKLHEALFAGFDTALGAVVAAREAEGARLSEILTDKLNEIESLVVEAENSPSRTPDAIKQRLQTQLQRIFGEDVDLDRDRLYQEAVILATRADIEEELKRLKSHIAGARDLIAETGPVGRKFEFLAQEFQREANTLCSKSNAADITRVGLRLKSAIDQFREQVQNVE
jgi:uncharacterized protein (TIGR00255 family)